METYADWNPVGKCLTSDLKNGAIITSRVTYCFMTLTN